jgi:hypothetical protein
MRTFFLLGALWLGLAACADTGSAGLEVGDASGVAEVGRRAPDVELGWLNRPGAPGTLHELRGRVVLLEFWRTW